MSDFDRNAARWGQSYARAGRAEIDLGLRSYMLGVYNNMVIGLAITGLVALGVHMFAVTTDQSQAVARIGQHILLTPFGSALYLSPLKYLVIFAPIAFVFFFSFRIEQMSAASARSLFFVFSAAMGLSISSILLIYTGSSIAQAFFITAATFGALSLYGYTTKRDLSPIGSFLVMGLFGLILAMLVNMFLKSSGLDFAISAIGVLIFAGLTAWDTQKIKELYSVNDDGTAAGRKAGMG